MPTCLSCNESFKNRIEIEGIVRNVNNRKYCLTCSPFGSKNTRKLHIPKKGREYTEYDRQYWKKRREELKDTRNRRKKEYVEMAGGGCHWCGYNRCIHSLHFHHRNPAEKLFEISSSHSMAREKVLEEIKKCILLCSNCHQELHSGMVPVLQVELQRI